MEYVKEDADDFKNLFKIKEGFSDNSFALDMCKTLSLDTGLLERSRQVHGMIAKNQSTDSQTCCCSLRHFEPENRCQIFDLSELTKILDRFGEVKLDSVHSDSDLRAALKETLSLIIQMNEKEDWYQIYFSNFLIINEFVFFVNF